MLRILQAEAPDFVGLSGDMISGRFWDKSEGWFSRM
jgi:hypothetical protein